ncbi:MULTISPECIES: flagellar export chaperone FliS [Actinosynnema]|uniref:Flagellar export chaperone FliS n=1 Tax=Actinosynnema pretiosum TaxID=42197 RepID=A0A290Z4J9_9PSEU|nr:flagellar export chaperone FliS [Actinosynnema pretiosum]ATE53928.1 flagellar export chaperone FliS [Actinosynnema pretiosum]
MRNTSLRDRYLDDSVSTASPGHLLVMLYDRLCLDLGRGATAMRAGDRAGASELVVHAQDILLELRGSLQQGVWEGSGQLSDLYSFLISELIRANTGQDPDKVQACLVVVEPLRDAWREAVHGIPAPDAARAG